MAGSGLAAAANWTTSDLIGLGWLAGTLDMDTLARIPARSMDGVRGFYFVREAACFLPVSNLFCFVKFYSNCNVSQRYGFGTLTSLQGKTLHSFNPQVARHLKLLM
jgi:hypothetical protein